VPVLSGDDAVVAFLRSIELAGVRLYAAGAPFLVSPVAQTVADAFRAHHGAHSTDLAALGGGAGVVANQALLANMAPSMQTVTSEQDELALLYAFEEQLAATYQWAMGRLNNAATLGEAAAILPVECQHAVVLGTLLDKTRESLIAPFQTDVGYLNPDDFPLR
jgi:hypothetical protein